MMKENFSLKLSGDISTIGRFDMKLTKYWSQHMCGGLAIDCQAHLRA